MVTEQILHSSAQGLVEEMAELEAELRSWRRHQHNRDEAGTGVDIFKGYPDAV